MSSLPPTSYSDLYQEAESQLQGQPKELTQEICPLYNTLRHIEDRYTDPELIGKGGMKEVYRVYDERTERRVALAHPKKGVPIERYDAFLREAHITARLEHPNIIKLFDMGIDDQDRPYFTMELKTGPSLRKILSNLRAGKDLDAYPYQRRLSIILRICEAISYAHSRRVLHLDLKPDNIQVGNFGEVQVCDWGMGEIERADTEEHHSVALLDPDLYGDQLDAVVKGTPGYMAPEQEDPRSTKSPQTEIYTLGCILYELATLNKPDQRQTQPPESPAVTAIIEKACAPEPQNRYPSVNALMEDIRRHLNGYRPKAEPTSFFREARRFYRRNRQPCLITLFFSTLLLGAGIWFTQQLNKSYQETTTALGETEEALERTSIALAKYEQEKDFSSALLDQTTDGIPDDAQLLFHRLMIDESITLNAIANALQYMDRELTKDPSPTNPLWTIKGYTLFMTQRFAEAEPCLKKRVGSRHLLLKLSPQFAPLVQSNGLLSTPDFIALLNLLDEGKQLRTELIEKMVVFDSLTRKFPKAQSRIVKAVLELSNPAWKNHIFDYDPTRRHLHIAGPGLKSLFRPLGSLTDESRGKPLCLLRLMNLRSLDLRGSQLNGLHELRGLDLESLDLRQTAHTQLSSLQQMPSLRTLIITKGQFTAEQLSLLPPTVQVTQK
ncbi:MAG: protein kinase domain-containing protein [Verrucomicrobiaceae bacterium]